MPTVDPIPDMLARALARPDHAAAVHADADADADARMPSDVRVNPLLRARYGPPEPAATAGAPPAAAPAATPAATATATAAAGRRRRDGSATALNGVDAARRNSQRVQAYLPTRQT